MSNMKTKYFFHLTLAVVMLMMSSMFAPVAAQTRKTTTANKNRSAMQAPKAAQKIINTLKINIPKSIRINLHNNARLNATISPESAQNKTLKWEVANPNIASVDQNGNITGKKWGITLVRVSTTDAPHAYSFCTVAVVPTATENNPANYDVSTVYELVDVSVFPKFPGNQEDLQDFLDDNFMAPQDTDGRVARVNFIVDLDGSISNITSEKSDPLHEELIRVVKLMPKWIPGKKKGAIVKTKMSFSIRVKNGFAVRN